MIVAIWIPVGVLLAPIRAGDTGADWAGRIGSGDWVLNRQRESIQAVIYKGLIHHRRLIGRRVLRGDRGPYNIAVIRAARWVAAGTVRVGQGQWSEHYGY